MLAGHKAVYDCIKAFSETDFMPCGAPGITFSVAPLTSFAESKAESAMGTI